MTRKEINKYIRKNTTPGKGEKCTCKLCGGKKDLSYHHYIKVEDLTHMCWYHDYDTKEELNEIYAPGGYLCDNCHLLFHSLMEDNYNEPELDLDTIYGIVEIISEIDLTQAPEDLYEDYASIVDEMTDTIVHNFIKYGDLTEEEVEELNEIMNERIYGSVENENEEEEI